MPCHVLSLLLFLFLLPRWCEGSLVIASRRPDFDGWYWTSEAVAAAEDEGAKVTVVAPPAPADKEVQSLAAVLWSQDKLSAEARAAAADDAEATVVLLLPETCDGTVAKRVFCVVLGDSDQLRRLSNSTWEVTVSVVAGSYLAGVLAGLHAARAGREVFVWTLPPVTKRDSAFVQGVLDSSPDTCVRLEAFGNLGGGTSPVVSDQRWNDLRKKTSESTGIVYYASLGSYTAAVLEVLGEKAASNYGVMGVSGTLVSTGGTAARPVVGWRSLFRRILSGEWDGASSSTLSDASTVGYPSDADDSTPSKNIRDTPCSGGATFASVVSGIASKVKKVAVPAQQLVAANGCVARTAGVNTEFVASFASGCLPKLGGTVRVVGVGVYLNTIGSVNLKDGVAYLDTNIYLKQHKNLFGSLQEAVEGFPPSGACPPALFYEGEWVPYINTSGDAYLKSLNFASMDMYKTVAPVQGVGGASYLRVQGNHFFNPDIGSWPFDRQRIKVVLEDSAESSTDNVTLVFCHLKDHSGMNPAARFYPGQSLADVAGVAEAWDATTTVQCWPHLQYPKRFILGQCQNGAGPPGEPVKWDLPNAEESCTCLGGTKASYRFTWSVLFVRPLTATMLKIVLAPITLTIVNEGTWLIHPESYTKRLSICGSTMVSIVLFHASLNAYTPPTSQFTAADRFMLCVYVSNIAVFLGVFLQSVLVQAEYHHLALHMHRFSRIWGILSSILSFLGYPIVSTVYAMMLWVLGAHISAFILVWRLSVVRRWFSRNVYHWYRVAEEQTASSAERDTYINELHRDGSLDGLLEGDAFELQSPEISSENGTFRRRTSGIIEDE